MTAPTPRERIARECYAVGEMDLPWHGGLEEMWQTTGEQYQQQYLDLADRVIAALASDPHPQQTLLQALLEYWNEAEEHLIGQEKPERLKEAWRNVLAAGCAMPRDSPEGAPADLQGKEPSIAGKHSGYGPSLEGNAAEAGERERLEDDIGEAFAEYSEAMEKWRTSGGNGPWPDWGEYVDRVLAIPEIRAALERPYAHPVNVTDCPPRVP